MAGCGEGGYGAETFKQRDEPGDGGGDVEAEGGGVVGQVSGGVAEQGETGAISRTFSY